MKNPLQAEEVGLQDIEIFIDILREELYKLINSPEFIQQYGRNMKYPQIMNKFYLDMIQNPEFINKFINFISWKDFLKDNLHLTNIEIMEKIMNVFDQYVTYQRKFYEITYVLKVFVLNYPLIVEYISNVIYFYYPISLDGYIICPQVKRDQEDLLKEINKSIFQHIIVELEDIHIDWTKGILTLKLKVFTVYTKTISIKI